jgi:small subunit ribosomal protein S9
MADERYYYGTGRRKEAVAQVRVYPGSGELTVNGRPATEYFSASQLARITALLSLIGRAGSLRISALVSGGGKSGQVDAMRHGIARALAEGEPELRPTLKRSGFLTRDSREKERKKYGLKRARKAPQFSKR